MGISFDAGKNKKDVPSGPRKSFNTTSGYLA